MFAGLGYGMAIVSAVACIYYNVIIAWAIYYIYQSYSVSWSSCDNAWNTPSCISKTHTSANFTFLDATENHTFWSSPDENTTQILSSVPDVKSTALLFNGSRMTASEEFWL